nr:hypothetical protein WNSECMFO_WNSECMFO_CDS_0007 [Microvirus sp.]
MLTFHLFAKAYRCALCRTHKWECHALRVETMQN